MHTPAVDAATGTAEGEAGSGGSSFATVDVGARAWAAGAGVEGAEAGGIGATREDAEPDVPAAVESDREKAQGWRSHARNMLVRLQTQVAPFAT